MSTQWNIGEPRINTIIRPPKYKWHMDFFGDGNLNFNFENNKALLNELLQHGKQDTK